jgi:hypothetical protein
MRGARFMAAAAGALVLAGAGGAVFWFAPDQHAFYPRCLFHSFTGWHCPGCGTLRALHYLLHGRWAAAVHANALEVVLLPFLLGYLGYRALRSREKPSPREAVLSLPIPFAWVLLGITVAFGLLRNLPGAPFTWLAP